MIENYIINPWNYQDITNYGLEWFYKTPFLVNIWMILFVIYILIRFISVTVAYIINDKFGIMYNERFEMMDEVAPFLFLDVITGVVLGVIMGPILFGLLVYLSPLIIFIFIVVCLKKRDDIKNYFKNKRIRNPFKKKLTEKELFIINYRKKFKL